MSRFSSGRASGKKKWILSPLIVGSAVLAVSSPAFALGGKIPVLPGNTVPVALGRQISDMRYNENVCQRTSSASLRAGAVAAYAQLYNHMLPELSSVGNTLVVPTIGFYCPQSGVASNITPGSGMAWVPVDKGNTVANLRHNAVTCAQTTDPKEYNAMVYDYNDFAFSPGALQDQLVAAGNTAVVPPIQASFCPTAP